MDDCLSLEKGFSEAQIFDCLRDCNGNKGPKPDGFISDSYRLFGRLSKETLLISSMIFIIMARL